MFLGGHVKDGIEAFTLCLVCWRLDDDWLIRKLRGALDISPHATTTQIIDGVWDIGRHKKRPVVLARRIDLVERHGLRIFHGPEPRSQSWVLVSRQRRHGLYRLKL